MKMRQVKITYANLFELIAQEEGISYELEKEHIQKTNLEIKDEFGDWVKINGMIIKKSPTIKITLDNSKTLVCANEHILFDWSKLIFAKDLKVGDTIRKANGVLSTVTAIESLDIQKVYDVEVDSKTHLYQCSIGVLHHNTLLTSAIIEYANRLNMRTITIVPSSSLLKQTHDYIKQFEIPVGMFGSGKKDDSKNIVATWQTLQNNKTFIKDFDCIIWDECVHPSSKIDMGDDSKKRIDEIVVGDVVKTINEKTLVIENKPVLKIHKNILKSKNQKMFKITMIDGSVLEITGNHEVLTHTGWKRVDDLTIEDEIIQSK